MKKIISLIYIPICLFSTIGKAQDNPYSTFGYVAQQPSYDITQRELFTIENKDIASEIQKYILDTEGGTLYAIGKKGDIIEKKTIRPDEVLRFLSVDPITRKYPELTPYQFANNTPIQAIDLDGLEDMHYFNDQKEKYIGLKMVIKILNETGIAGEILQQFAAGNNKTDMYFNVDQLGYSNGKTYSGETRFYGGYKTAKMFYKSGTDEEREGIDENQKYAYNSSSYSKLDEQNNLTNPDQSFVWSSTLSKGKGVILLVLGEKDIIDAGENLGDLAEATLTAAHEPDAHGINYKNGTNFNSTQSEHFKFHGDKAQMAADPSGDKSPSYKNLDPQSKAGGYKKRIDEYIKTHQKELKKMMDDAKKAADNKQKSTN